MLFPPADETEYEYSGSEEEDDGRGEEGEPRYGGQRGGVCSFWPPLGKECQACRLALWQLTDPPFPLCPPPSSIMNVPGESTLRREFLRLQQENKSNSEALKLQQQLAAQHRDSEAHIKHLLHQRQRRIEEQKEERRRVEEVGQGLVAISPIPCYLRAGPSGGERPPWLSTPTQLPAAPSSVHSSSAESGSSGSCRARSTSGAWRTCK